MFSLLPLRLYQLVRFACLVELGCSAYCLSTKNKVDLIVFGALVLLSKLFAKITLERELLNIIHIGVAIYLVISLFKGKTKD